MSVASKAVLGALWTVATGLGTRVISLVCTLALTRFVDPVAYGEVSVAAVVVQTASLLSAVGAGQYIASRPKATREAIFHATVFHIGFGCVGIGLALLLRGPIGEWVGAPGMSIFVPGLAFAILLERIALIPERLLVRNLNFRAVGLILGGGELAYAGLSLLLAWKGYGAMSIVIGNIARMFVRLLAALALTDRRDWLTPTRITGPQTRELFGFGLPLVVASLFYYGSQRWDNLVVSALFGAGLVGMYNLAYNLADIPAIQIGERIGDVLLPSFAHTEREHRRPGLLRAFGLLGLCTFPLALGLGAIANSLVATFFDARWAPVGPMLAVLSALSVVRPVGWVAMSYLQADGKVRTLMGLEIVKTVSLVLGVWALGRFGPLWACAMVGVAFGLNAFFSLWVLRNLEKVSLFTLVRPLVRPLLACVPMVLAVLAARRGMALTAAPAWLGLVAEIAAGALSYAVSALVIARETSRDMINLLRGALRRKKKVVPPAPVAP